MTYIQSLSSFLKKHFRTKKFLRVKDLLAQQELHLEPQLNWVEIVPIKLDCEICNRNEFETPGIEARRL